MTCHDPRQRDLLALLDRPSPPPSSASPPPAPPEPGDFASIYGNEIARRALEIAAVGKHSIALVTAGAGGEKAAASLLTAAQPLGVFRGFSTERGEAADLIVEVHEPRDCDRCIEQEGSAAIAARVEAARPRVARWPKPSDRDEATWSDGLDEPARKLLEDAAKLWQLDDRAQARVWLVARSIAALADVQTIGRIHIAEALAYFRAPSPPPEPPPDPQPEPEPSAADSYFQNISRGREVVEVDAKRLDYDGGDISRSYSAQSLADKDGSVKSPFRFRGAEWVSVSGGGNYCQCYRIVPLDAFDGPSAPYCEHGFLQGEQRERFGGYHGMSAKHGSRDVVLQGPPVLFVAGAPDQSALL